MFMTSCNIIHLSEYLKIDKKSVVAGDVTIVYKNLSPQIGKLFRYESPQSYPKPDY